MIEKTRPALNTFSQVDGIQVSMETTKAPRRMYQPTLTTRSIWGARSAAVVGGVGGSTEDNGSLVLSRLRSPGTMSRAAMRTMNGRDVSAAEDHTLLTGR